MTICKATGCDKPANRVGAGLCEAHYARLRRYGDCNHQAPPAQVLEHSQGYLLAIAKGHPLARGGLRAYQHRLVFHTAHGAGPFQCHWCQKQVTWSTMHVDHLDDDVQNNEVSNLVASCPGCNLHRNESNHRAVYRRKFGLTVDGVTKNYSEWAAPLGISAVSLKARIAGGWDLHRAVSEPRGRTGPRASRAACGGEMVASQPHRQAGGGSNPWGLGRSDRTVPQW